MLGVVILLILIGGLLLVLFSTERRGSSPTPQKPTMLLAHDSTDIVSESYLPAIRDSSMPFPQGKKKERKKTETFRKHAKD